MYRRRIPAGWNVGMLLWLKHNLIKVWVGTYKQQPYPYRSSATKFQSNFHIREPFHWYQAIPEHFETIRTDTAPVQPFWGDLDWFEFVWNLGIPFTAFSIRFHQFPAISDWLKHWCFIHKRFESFWSRFEAVCIFSFVLSCFVVIPICFDPFRAILYSFHLFLSCRFVVELL